MVLLVRAISIYLLLVMNWLSDFLLKFEDLFLCKIRDLQHTHSNMAQPVNLSIC